MPFWSVTSIVRTYYQMQVLVYTYLSTFSADILFALKQLTTIKD